jgi:two-component system heavy metal sensor histidine kinase CusS
MSSRIELKSWSLANRLTLWFTLAVCVLSGTTIGSIYVAVALQQDRETDEWLCGSAEFMDANRAKVLSEPDLWIYLPTRLIDESGRVAFVSPQLLKLFPGGGFPPPGPTGRDVMGSDGRTYRLVSTRQGNWTYQFAHDRSAESELLAQLRRNIVLAAVPTLIISLALGYLLARQGLKPITVITSAARAVSPQNLRGRVPMHGHPAELHELAETLNAALARMEDAFARLDQFSTDVAHELRTPVHNLRGGIEVALSQPRTSDGYRNALSNALNESDRLGRLVDRLLFLAQAEDPRREIKREPTDVMSELEDVREFFSPAATEVEVALNVAPAISRVFLLDRALFQRALSNLVANAIAHTPPRGTVNLAAESTEAELIVTVDDTGCGIESEDLPHLFDRYYRSQSARATGRGVGLGLAIVRRVVELHDGTVTIESTPGQGTRVRMTFPLPSRNGTSRQVPEEHAVV